MSNVVIKPNEMQQKAIDILKGQVMLLAGPGTGKTFTVIHRIEKMLADGIDPSSILCLTYSDAAANEMRQRLIKKMGVIASSVDIYTYHSFCNDIIKTYPSQFDLSVGVRVITDTEKITLMKECIDEVPLQFFVAPRGDRYYFTKSFVGHIEKLKSKRITKEDYFECIQTNPTLVPRLKELESEIYEREQRGETRNKGRYQELEKIKSNIERAKELWALYEAYSEKMINNNLIDFSDMINFVLDEFDKDIPFLTEVSNKYKYFLVDEYQDTNQLQNAIIFSLVDANKEKNVFVVGDDDQIIYGFQGARIDTIENFLTKYPETQVICLQENNRSTQSILDFSYAVISQDEKRLENNQTFKDKHISKRLTAKNLKIIPYDKKIRMLHFGESLQEINHIVDDIKALVDSDNCPKNDNGEKDLSKISIIAKKRAELQMYAEMLKGKNIPIQIDDGRSIFAIRSSILIYFYLKAMTNNIFADDKLFGLLLAEPFKINLEDYNKILKEKQLFREDVPNDFISLMRVLDGWKDEEKIKNFLETFDDLKLFASNNSLRNTIIEVLNRTGILITFHNESKNKMENLMGIKKFIDEATEFGNLNKTASIFDFVKYLDDCLLNEIDITTDKNPIVQNAVQLTTYHGSKGREFEFVYLPNLISKNWEDFSMPGEYKLVVDEILDPEEAKTRKDSELLKLLFVGITRAKHTLTISFADTKEDYLKQVYQSDEDYETLKSLLINKKNIILQGCPGVGKSFSARKLAYTIMGEIDDTRIKYIQFHQNYSYEDFIMGYKPNDDGFKLETGVFYEFCKKAENDPQKRPYFFIIDEINRGNLSKVFGELLLAIENEYRGKPITLAYDRTTFTVPKNLYIIGMMNTADRSLAMIDYALRRRFSFFPMNPAFGSDGFIKYQESLHNEKFNKLIETIKKLNIAISNDESLGEGFCIGHSYFCNKNADECSDGWLKEVVNYDILPTLQEYWFDDKDSYETWGKELSGVVDDNR